MLTLLLALIPLTSFAQETLAPGAVGVGAQDDTETSLEARIVEVTPAACEAPHSACEQIRMVGTTGTFKGQTITITTDERSFLAGKPIDLKPGDSVVLETQMVDGQQKFAFTDIVRRPALGWLFVLFVLCVVLVGGLTSFRSLLGMILSIAFLFWVMLPRMLAGDNPLALALIGSFVIMAITFFVTHGWNAKMWSALLGTALALLLTAFLAAFFTGWARLFGFADEDAVFLSQAIQNFDTRGVLLAGIIIGTLGSLDDVTISQASAVFELKVASPALSAKQLYKRALRIGRDHIAGAINTLVLAYAGASLPLLLLLSNNAHQESWFLTINRETFATEIVRTLVGSLGLLAAVPFATVVASYFASRMDAATLKKLAEHHH